MSRFFIALLAFGCIAGFLWALARPTEEPVAQPPVGIFAQWYAQDGPHKGRSLRIDRARVELRVDGVVVDGGPLRGVHRVPGGGSYRKYRLEFASEPSPGSLTVMLDARGNLRLANKPASTWVQRQRETARGGSER